MFKRTAFVPVDASLPQDVTLVLLNAYEVNFTNPLDHVLKRNVSPVLRILDQREKAKDRIRGISIVSTVYVQQPLPRRQMGNASTFVSESIPARTTCTRV